jgi:alkylation response protein AidB-like acyl-CoA dehydrogenase
MGVDVFERARPHLTDLGAIAGGELDALAAIADRNPPVLRAWDERGRRVDEVVRRVDEVVRHPAYRRMEEIAFSRFGLAAMAHRPGVLGWPGRAPQVLKYALSYLFAQSEFGLLCPVNMTDSCARMLGAFGSEELKARYLPHLTATEPAALWQGTQWMTERTGGSDVGASTTVARRGADGEWRLWGDKWFTSVANAELALTLARPDARPRARAGSRCSWCPSTCPTAARTRGRSTV